MTQAKAVNQRVILLATTRSQSVIGEVCAGHANSIGYSPYGKQSAQQPIATALGFNGQLRESNIGWYILGNGYRAYNPVLMRFHSPDSWSPFGSGGLNPYMYCVGDPVNRVDPTGHSIWGAIKLGIQENVSWGNSMESMRARTIARRANGIARQEKMYAIGHSPKNQDPLVRPTGSVTGALFGAGVNAGLPANFAGGSPPSSASPHKYANGVAPTHPSSSYGIVYPGVPSSGPSASTGAKYPSVGSNGRRASSGSLPSYEEATSTPMKLWNLDTIRDAHQPKTVLVNRMEVFRTDNLQAAAPYQALTGVMQAPTPQAGGGVFNAPRTAPPRAALLARIRTTTVAEAAELRNRR